MTTRPLLAAAVAALALGGLAGYLDRGAAAPPDDAAALVPADALVYVHLSTEQGREPDERLAELLGRFTAYRRLRALLEAAVSQRAGGFDLARDVRSWLGEEAAFALLDTGGATANSLILLSVADEPRAQGVLRRAAGAQPGVRHRGVAVRRFGGVSAAFVGGFLVVGQEPGVRAAIDLQRGRGRALQSSDVYRRATSGHPRERVLSAYASPDGIRRVLRAQPGVAGAIGGLLDHPRLQGVTLALAPEEHGLRIHARQARARATGAPFEPMLLDAVPDNAASYLGLGGLDAAAAVLPAAGAGAALERLRRAIGGDSGVDLDRDVLGPLRGEVALSITASLPAPVITLVARTTDAARTREALGRLQGVIAENLARVGEGQGSVPTFEERDVAGVTAYALALGPGFELLYAVFDGRLVLSTAASGIQRVREGGALLRDDEAFRRAVGPVPDQVEAVLFSDLGQLLSLGDQVGLTDSPAYQTARDDLRKVRAIGAVAQREGTDTTAELFLEIP